MGEVIKRFEAGEATVEDIRFRTPDTRVGGRQLTTDKK